MVKNWTEVDRPEVSGFAQAPGHATGRPVTSPTRSGGFLGVIVGRRVRASTVESPTGINAVGAAPGGAFHVPSVDDFLHPARRPPGEVLPDRVALRLVARRALKRRLARGLGLSVLLGPVPGRELLVHDVERELEPQSHGRASIASARRPSSRTLRLSISTRLVVSRALRRRLAGPNTVGTLSFGARSSSPP